MQDQPVETGAGEFIISTDRRRLDFELLHAVLNTTHWAAGMPLHLLQRAIEHSICFGVYHGRRQVGFARAVTDRATYAHLTDLFIVESYRGRGLGRWLVTCILDHPDLQGLRRIALVTGDAAGFYQGLGFGPPPESSAYLERRAPELYDLRCVIAAQPSSPE